MEPTKRYVKQALIGQGGMGEVWKVYDQLLQTTWAMKQVHKDCDSETHASFIRECQLLTRLRHPAIPRIVDTFSTMDGEVVIMDYVEGRNLSTFHLVEEKTLLDWADQLLKILAYLHKQKVLYCDLKPQNIILSNNHIHLIDFGAAIDMLQPVCTRYGTIGFAAPEQLEASALDERTDIYGFGKTLYSLSVQSSDVNNPLSKDFDMILQTCMCDEQTRRYAKIEEVQAALKQIHIKPVVYKKLFHRLCFLTIFFTCCTLGCAGTYTYLRNAQYNERMVAGDYLGAIQLRLGKVEPYLRFYETLYAKNLQAYRQSEAFDVSMRYAMRDTIKRMEDFQLAKSDIANDAILHYELGIACLQSGDLTLYEQAYRYYFEIAKQKEELADAPYLQHLAYYAYKGDKVEEDERVDRKADLQALFTYYRSLPSTKRLKVGYLLAQIYGLFAQELQQDEFENWLEVIEDSKQLIEKENTQEENLPHYFQLATQCYMEAARFFKESGDNARSISLYETLIVSLEKAKAQGISDLYFILNIANASLYRYQATTDKEESWLLKANEQFAEALAKYPNSTAAKAGKLDCERLMKYRSVQQ